MATAAYPGTFNPPTIAHLAIATAAWQHGGFDRIDLILSEVPLGKEDLVVPPVADRLTLLQEVADRHPWLRARSTEAQLLADVAAGYDAIILGADKWAQISDPAWYGGSEDARHEVLARLPTVLVVPRPPFPLPPQHRVLMVDDAHATVSSTAVRAGRRDWMLPEAVAFDLRTGAWSDPEHYRSRPGT